MSGHRCDPRWSTQLEDAVTFRLSSAWPQKQYYQPKNNKYQQSGDHNPYQGVLKAQPIEIRLHFSRSFETNAFNL